MSMPLYPQGTWTVGIKGHCVMSIWIRSGPSRYSFHDRLHIVRRHLRKRMKEVEA